jgi:predicted nucleic acid-binding protein
VETKVRYLVDTNVWLERLLDQEKSEIASRFFNLISIEDLFVSDFSIHSIGVILSRLKKFEVFEKFIDDLFVNGQIEQLSLDPNDLLDVISNIQKFNLDFDDAYQLSVSQKYDLVIVTFDKDFNTKGIRKNTPEEIIQQLGTTDWDSLIV